jgi:hypothetical protein
MQKPLKDTLKLLLLSLPLVAIQACSSPELKQQSSNSVGNTSNNSDRIMPKEFEGRFSSNKIKHEREAYYLKKRTELRKTSPSQKVNQALRSNNIYLMEVPGGRGGSRSIPGLIEPKVVQVNCRTVPAEGMGDVLYGKNHLLYRQEILQFMQEFNAMMAPYCK